MNIGSGPCASDIGNGTTLGKLCSGGVPGDDKVVGLLEGQIVYVTIFDAADPTNLCGNYELTVCRQSSDPPKIIVPADNTIEWPADWPADFPNTSHPSVDPSADGRNGQPLGEASGLDNDCPNSTFEATFADGPLQATGDACVPWVFERTWTVLNPCGDDTSDVQLIFIQDTTPPEFKNLPGEVDAEIEWPAVLDGVSPDDDPDLWNQVLADLGVQTPTANDNCTPGDQILLEVDNRLAGPFDCSAGNPVFILVRTWTATDLCGQTGGGTSNASSYVQLVDITDATAPVITVPPNDAKIQASNPGDCFADVPDFALDDRLEIMDNCAALGFTFIQDPPPGPFDFDRPGFYDVTLTAVDNCGNESNTVTIELQVNDIVDPIIVRCPPSQDAKVDDTCQAILGDLWTGVGEAFDNCSDNLNVLQIPPAGTSLNGTLGSTVLVRFFVIDQAGNDDTCAVLVTLVDNDPPVLSGCPTQDIKVNVNPGDCVASGGNVGLPTVTAADNCDGDLGSVDSDAPDDFPKGDTTVTWTAMDSSGNTATCSVLVTVNDNEPPMLVGCPVPGSIIAVNVDPGTCQATGVTLPEVTATDLCKGDLGVVPNDAPAAFDKGDTTVTWMIEDGNTNVASCSVIVRVTDNEAPVLTGCPVSDIVVFVDPGTCQATGVILPEVTANDLCKGDLGVVLSDAPAAFDKGDTTVTWSIADGNGNTATCSVVVTVIDNEDPILTECPAGPIVVETDKGQCDTSIDNVALPEVTAEDTCKGDVDVTVDAPAVFPLGDTVVTWTADDGNGNTATCSVTVTVEDNEPPDITGCPTEGPKLDADAGCNVLVPDVTGGVSGGDNCPGAVIVSQDPAAGTTNSGGPGFYDIVVTVEDASGNTDTCTVPYEVNDIIDPVIVRCPTDKTGADAILANADKGCMGVVPDLTGEVVAEDNCDGIEPLTITQSPAAGTNIPIGTTQVTISVTDGGNNLDQCFVDVEVLPFNNVSISVQLENAVLSAATARCLEITLFDCNGGETLVQLDSAQFSAAGLFTADLIVPCGAYECVSIRDPLHSLVRYVTPTVDNRAYVIDTTLVYGNLNNDTYVDVLDFGVYAGQFQMPGGYGFTDTDCNTPKPHADFNGDGFVTPADVTYISNSFLASNDAPCCPIALLAGPTLNGNGPVTEISVAQLYLQGMGQLAVADLNADGVLNTADLVAFLNGARPELSEVAFTGEDGGSWFDQANWSGDSMPNENTKVTLNREVLVDQMGAVAREVFVEAGGKLHLFDGSLTAQTVTIELGGTLALTGNALLSVESLILSEGAMLQWAGGTIEVAGGLYTQADLDLLIGNGTLRLLDGATATIQRHIYIGLTPTEVGVLQIDGHEASLISGEAIFVGVDGHGVVSLIDGGMIVTPEFFIGPMGELTGDGTIDGDLTSDGVLTVHAGHELLQVTGMAQLGGTLHLVLPEALEVGDRFTVLTAAAVVGQFMNMETPADVTVTVTYELDRVTITVTETGPKLTPDQDVQFDFLP